MLKIKRAKRLTQLPPYLFAELDRMKAAAKEKGMDIISLGIGDPDLPTPQHIIKSLAEAAKDPANHQYPSYAGMLSFREACAEFMKKRFGVAMDPKREIMSLIGSKEGIAHLPVAFVEPGDVVLMPNPGYPVYQAGTVFCGGTCHFMPLKKENEFLPDLDAIPAEVTAKAKIMWINYPNNPTAATAPLEFYKKAVAFAKEHGILLCSDAAYTEMCYDGYRAPSIFEVEGAKDVAIEFHSLSKTYNMTGWRVGWVAGNAEAIAGLGAVKENMDSGLFQGIQHAALTALTSPQDCVVENCRIWQERRDIIVKGLREAGWKVDPPKATFYVWCETPNGLPSMEVTSRILNEAGVVTTPGVGFGEYGEGFVRLTFTVGKERLNEAVERIKKITF